ncbi:hypothetical protein GLOIN_2v1709121 [Rhizophagus clarus]|uniref:SAM domain-containing protein n=1 Tax=Rhizophagus clarus TaxID=94130 RepID=A0A8H3QKS4_9GLOM|nr:hypothetical protein GLOIN_2v1709121 [Rhizophagus clarus]
MMTTTSEIDSIKKYKTNELIDLLRKEDLELYTEDLEIIRKQKINGRDFLNKNKEEFRNIGFKLGPALRLKEFAEECKKRKKRFSSYKTKKEVVLTKFGIDNSIKNIPKFVPQTINISDDDDEFQYCIREIKRKMEIIGPARSSNEAVRCLYIETILVSAILIVKRIVREKIFLEPQREIVDEEATG